MINYVHVTKTLGEHLNIGETDKAQDLSQSPGQD
jgi:hypothetical protein